MSKVNVNDWKTIEEATDDPYKTLCLISDIACGYDGYRKSKSLMELIDELKGYADSCIEKAVERNEVK